MCDDIKTGSTVNSATPLQEDFSILSLQQLFKDTLNKLTLFSTLLLLVAVIRGGSYEFFQILRVAVTTNACLFAYRTFQKHKVTAVLFAGIAVLFNPLIPVYLNRDIWRLIDLGVLVILVWSILRNEYRKV